MALRTQRAGDVTWHRSLISILGLSRLLMFFMGFDVTASLGFWKPLYQYRKWAISCYCRRLLGEMASWQTNFAHEFSEKNALEGIRQLPKV
jgi:hypothetical protein